MFLTVSLVPEIVNKNPDGEKGIRAFTHQETVEQHPFF